MTLEEIKNAVDAGKVVNCKNGVYEVRKDKYSYYIICTLNNSVQGLIYRDTFKLIDKEQDFYISEK